MEEQASHQAGRLCLAKSFLTSLPAYAMQAFWLPESVWEVVDKKLRNCIWAKGGNNRSWNLVPWKEIACPKAIEGLGLKSICNNNIAMLGMLVDSLLHEKDTLWAWVLLEKYVPNAIILAGNYKSGDSYIWKGIIQAKNNIVEGYGSSSFWYHN